MLMGHNVTSQGTPQVIGITDQHFSFLAGPLGSFFLVLAFKALSSERSPQPAFAG